MRVLLVGPPGAGKGTQAAVLSEELGVPHISTGELFREHVGNATELGRTAKEYMDAGELVPDEVTNAMVRERLNEDDAQQGFLLDGYPRNVTQAEELSDVLARFGAEIETVLELDVPEDELVARLLERGRDDDTEDVIRRRQQVYRSETEPLLDYYSDRVLTVEALGSVQDVTARALEALRAQQ